MGVLTSLHNDTAAFHAMRQKRRNVSKLGAALEKLSSGYKVNRSADDAAGLAISEKMRLLYAGLDQAEDNSRHGQRLIQIGEGALGEVHEMLRRMATLAEQSANGTYSDILDREQLQKEVERLCTEIGRVAESTNFNGIKLFQDVGYEMERAIPPGMENVVRASLKYGNTPTSSLRMPAPEGAVVRDGGREADAAQSVSRQRTVSSTAAPYSAAGAESDSGISAGGGVPQEKSAGLTDSKAGVSNASSICQVRASTASPGPLPFAITDVNGNAVTEGYEWVYDGQYDHKLIIKTDKALIIKGGSNQEGGATIVIADDIVDTDGDGFTANITLKGVTCVAKREEAFRLGHHNKVKLTLNP